jgi:hypothetical protein
VVEAVKVGALTDKRLQIPNLESRIAARAGFPNPERQSCREIFCARLVTTLKPELAGAWHCNDFAVGHASRSPWRKFELLLLG